MSREREYCEGVAREVWEGDRFNGWDELARFIEEQREHARKEEREACAKASCLYCSWHQAHGPTHYFPEAGWGSREEPCSAHRVRRVRRVREGEGK